MLVNDLKMLNHPPTNPAGGSAPLFTCCHVYFDKNKVVENSRGKMRLTFVAEILALRLSSSSLSKRSLLTPSP